MIKKDSSPSNSSNSSDFKKGDSSGEDSPVFAPRKNNPPSRSFLHHHNRVQPVRDIELTAAHHQQALQLCTRVFSQNRHKPCIY